MRRQVACRLFFHQRQVLTEDVEMRVVVSPRSRSSRFFTGLVSSMAGCLVVTSAAQGLPTAVSVPGVACPWLAGFPDGTNGYDGDYAPYQAPVLVPVAMSTGASFTVMSATGAVSKGGVHPYYGPDGQPGDATGSFQGPFGGIGYLLAPKVSLVGVFLDDTVPLNSPPGGLSFPSSLDRDFLNLAPALRQPFFIGDGRTSSNVVQEFFAPAGATRLFLGVTDQAAWNDNLGSFSVTLDVVPEPSTAVVLLVASGMILRHRRRSGLSFP